MVQYHSLYRRKDLIMKSLKSVWKKAAVFGLAAVTSAGLLAGNAFAGEADAVYRTVDEIK